MTLLVFGQSGQVALDLQRQVGPDAPFLILGRDRADLREPAHCAEIINRTRPAVVINTAAFNGPFVDENNEAEAQLVNAEAPGAIARACANRRIPFIHISSADVFDGTGDTPRKPDDPTAPRNAFGRTKLAGEAAIRGAGGPHVILRTSWVFSAHGDNFLTAVLRQSRQQEPLEFDIEDISAPTPGFDLARACLISAERLLEDRTLSGTYHYQGAPCVSRVDFAREILDQAGIDRDVVEKRHKRPESIPARNGRLDCTRADTDLGMRQPDWRRGISFILDDLGLLKRK